MAKSVYRDNRDDMDLWERDAMAIETCALCRQLDGDRNTAIELLSDGLNCVPQDVESLVERFWTDDEMRLIEYVSSSILSLCRERGWGRKTAIQLTEEIFGALRPTLEAAVEILRSDFRAAS